MSVWKTKALLLLPALLLAGCATPKWSQVGGEYKNEPYNFSAELPPGWMSLNGKEGLLATKDGFSLQSIAIGRMEVNKPLPNTKKELKRGMLPQEAAEVVVDSFSSEQNYLNLEILENVPAKVGDYEGFRGVWMYGLKDGLKKKNVFYGFFAGDYYYYLRYSAPRRYYYDRDIDAFEKVVRSFKLVKTP